MSVEASQRAVPTAKPGSGDKYVSERGIHAIRNGQARRDAGVADASAACRVVVPAPAGDTFERVDALVERHGLATVCREARCPNIGECWNRGTATLMLLGEVCTRACRFCAVDTGQPRGWTDPAEPFKVAQTVRTLGLRHVVLTSVNRDDLPDGGAGHFAATVRAVRAANAGTSVEVLTPDFQGVAAQVDTVLDAGVDVFAHNLETVRRLSPDIRDRRAGYDRSLAVLAHAARHPSRPVVKTSLMLGLGETGDEVEAAMADARGAGVSLLTLGQYLRPTIHHAPIVRRVPEAEFASLRRRALDLGFAECVAGPLVRSSYRADVALAQVRAAR